MLRGREFAAADRHGSTKVAIVNESMARHYFGDANPIGRFVSIPGYRGDAELAPRSLARYATSRSTICASPSTLMLYVPMFQAPEGGATFEIRTSMDPAYTETAISRCGEGHRRRLPVFSVKSLDNQLDDSLVEERLVASLSSAVRPPRAAAHMRRSLRTHGLHRESKNRRDRHSHGARR